MKIRKLLIPCVGLALFGLASCETKVETTFTINFMQDDQATLIYSYKAKLGEQIIYGKEAPTKAEDSEYTYSFKEWDHALGKASKDENFYAVYTKTAKNGGGESDKTKLSAPTITLNDDVITWNAVENAEEYKIYVNDTETSTTASLNYVLSYTEAGDYKVKVKATSSDSKYEASDFSNEVTYTISALDPDKKEFDTPIIIGPTDEKLSVKKTHFEDTIKKNGPLADNAFPSTGTPKMLVVPVDLDSTKATDKALNDIKLAFGGTSEETGWESLNSFYKKASYGKLDIQFEFIDEWFKPSKEASYYEKYIGDDNSTGSDLLLNEVLDYYDSRLNFADFDYDNDGYIDSVWMVYSHAVDFSGESDFYWAYQTITPLDGKWDEKEAAYYAFAGIDFMYDVQEKDYPTDNFVVDAHTFIHESGHLMGLDDYYDYDDKKGSNSKGLMGADMMDANIGDHGCMNKLLLGWVDPTIVEGKGDATIDLSVFTTTGDFLIVTDHKLDTIYDEYFIVEFYKNVGLNENDQPVYSQGEEVIGIRIIHVDAHLNLNSKGEVEMNDSEVYQTAFKYNNSDTAHPFIEMLAKDAPEAYATGECLYTQGDSFGKDYNSFKLNSGKSLFFDLTVNNINEDSAKITVSFR